MKREKINFKNESGEQLSAYLEMPLGRAPHNFAVFAHCFTCNKNFKAVKIITEALVQKGFGVLRFDFTGLGQSEGDFEDTNFSSNVQDLQSACQYLSKEHQSPSLLIGHSLGGAAVLMAASQMDSVKAVATIGAPADPEHVTHLLEESMEEIKKNGIAKVNIGGRSFTVKKQFLDDLEEQSLASILGKMRKALLFMHSPQDSIVEVANAATLYQAAHHPKSFVSLDKADHLLGNTKDALYVGSVIGEWASRYLETEPLEGLEKESGSTWVRLLPKEEGYSTEVISNGHRFLADEPESYGGDNSGPSPYDLLAAALATCKAITLKMYANKKKWDIDEIKVRVQHEKVHAKDLENGDESQEGKIDHFNSTLVIQGSLDQEQLNRMVEISEKCPVHQTLSNAVKVSTQLQD